VEIHLRFLQPLSAVTVEWRAGMACDVATQIATDCARITSTGDAQDDSTPMMRRLLAARTIVPIQIIPSAGSSQSVAALRDEFLRQWDLPRSDLREALENNYNVDTAFTPTEVLASRCADGTYAASCAAPPEDDDGGLSDGAKIAIAVVVIVVGGALIAAIVYKCFCSKTAKRPVQFSGVELQYDESVRPVLSSPLHPSSDATGAPSPAGHAASGAPQFEEVADDLEMIPQGRSHRASVI